MPEKRRQYEQEFKEGAVRIVRESGKSIAEIARDLDINAGDDTRRHVPLVSDAPAADDACN